MPYWSCCCWCRVMNTEEQLFIQNESFAIFCFSSFVKLMESTALLNANVAAKVKNSASLLAPWRFDFGSDFPHCQ